MKSSYLVALTPLFLALPAAAQGTAEQRKACMGDAWRLCRADFTGGVEAITACMKRERDRLGTACRVVMDKAEGETRQATAPPPPAKDAVPVQTAEAPPPAPSATPAPAEPARTATGAPAEPPPAAIAQSAPIPPPRVVARRSGTVKAVAARQSQHLAVAARRPVRQVAAARSRPDDDRDLREADQWMRRFGLGGVTPEMVRGFRQFEDFFDVKL